MQEFGAQRLELMPEADAEAGLAAFFERLAAMHGDRKAMGSGVWQPSYAELNRAANCLAHRLLAQGGVPGDRVAVLARHDGPLLAGMLAGLKAGRIVTVLNPTHPPARLAQLCGDAGASVILTDADHRALAATAAGSDTEVAVIDLGAMGTEHDPGIPVSPDETAFLIYTSGSTGPAKGVMQPHRMVMRNAKCLAAALELRPDDRVSLLASLSGGQGMAAAWSGFAAGAALCPFDTAMHGAAALPSWLRDEGISVYISSASLFRNVARILGDGALPRVRIARLASEPATSDDVRTLRHVFPNATALVHTLASSESGNIAALRLAREDAVVEERLPVGRPLDKDTEILIVDEGGHPVSAGNAGEIVVRSPFLAAGYWRDPALTAARFRQGLNGVSFHTGDLGRLTADGMLEVLGRSDARIKLRGYRIEPSEIEGALLRLPEVERAVVDARERSVNEPRLIAYLVLRDGTTTSARALRRALVNELPTHMIPSGFAFLDALPLTGHGKVDREALRQIELPVSAHDAAERPRGETESLLAAIWADALDVSGIGRSDDFFELGGDSLIAAVVSAQVHAATGVDLEPAAFYEHSTLAALATAIETLRRAPRPREDVPLVPVPRDRPLPLSFAQERIWRHCQSPRAYISFRTYKITGPLDTDLLRDCMSYLAGRHEMLRTTFGVLDGQPVQIIHPPKPVELPVIDVSQSADPNEQAKLMLGKEAEYVFNLEQAPLQKFVLVRLGDGEHRLFRIGHHILFDGWSWQLYFRELAMLYDAALRRAARPLPAAETLDYADYAVWQQANLRRGDAAYMNCLAWWRDRYVDGSQPIKLPFKRDAPASNLNPEDGVAEWSPVAETAHRLELLGREAKKTSYAIHLAAFTALLADAIGTGDIVVGAYVTNRRRMELQRMFGFFTNLVTLRFTPGPQLSFSSWLSDVQATLADTEAHADIPYDDLRAVLRSQGVDLPEINAIVRAPTSRLSPLRFADLELTPLEGKRVVMPWGFTLSVNEGHTGRATFNANLYDPAAVRALLERYVRLLDAISRQPDLQMSELLKASKLG